ncbi:unnamed protein product [Gulo gulo]|uniref:Uncharacterized protein n=1 Tax=Gulo gulo TaxID=48420 RepID=A0A9X9LEY5_GULGU|nr:unnamed protein product [Gulo gulo]
MEAVHTLCPTSCCWSSSGSHSSSWSWLWARGSAVAASVCGTTCVPAWGASASPAA